MTIPSKAPVIIIGGGPVGAGLALELGLRGVECVVVEKYPTPQPIPKGQNLTQRTMEHFHFWGIEKELRAARTIPREYGIGGLTAYGTLLSGYDYDWLQRELVRPYYFSDNERLPQYATEAVLRKRMAELPQITTLYGWQVETISQDQEGVTIGISGRNGEGRQILRSAYAVGCDGSKSMVREAAGISQRLSEHEKLMVLLVFRSQGLNDLLQRFPRKSYYNVLHPDLKGYWQFFGRVDRDGTWFFHAPVPLGTTQDNFDFTAYLHRAVGAEFDVEFDHIGFWDLRFAVADNYRAGRLFIAGDAAHSHPPYGGYGVNSGFEDARNLGWKLAAILAGWGGDGLLDSYSAERQPVFASTARDFIEKSIHTDRDFLAKHAPANDRTDFEQHWAERAHGATAEVNTFEPHYEGSPIICGVEGRQSSAVGKHVFSAQAGHHLAPLSLASGKNVYEELGPGFTLISCRAEIDTEPFARAARKRDIPLAVVHGDAVSTASYGAELILVRPDQYVAWIGMSHFMSPGEALDRAVGRLCANRR